MIYFDNFDRISIGEGESAFDAYAGDGSRNPFGVCFEDYEHMSDSD